MSKDRSRPWHNPTPLVGFEPDWAGQFDTFNDWLNHASRALTGVAYSTGGMGRDGNGIPAICVDTKGRRCAIGKDFMLARDQDAFPVRYFWSMCPAEAQDEVVAE